MAVYDLEEQERIDALRDWWERNRLVIIAVIVILIATIGGYHGWKIYQASQNEQAEALHKSFAKVAETRDVKKTADAAAELASGFPASFHASDAALVAAKVAFETKDLETARKHLQWVADHGKADLRPIANLRLAAILMEEKKFDDAVKVVDAVTAEAFIPLAADLKGDILMAKGDRQGARTSWQLAVDKAGERSPVKSIVQFKLDSVGGGVTK